MKKFTDLTAIAFLICAIITGVKLHIEVHHLCIYHNGGLWIAHIISGAIVALSIVLHCIQHKYWFKNYVKIPAVRKGVTTLVGI